MNSYQQRVEEELLSLNQKLRNLNAFIATDTYDTLPLKEQELLWDQSNVMQDYANILQDRLFMMKDKE